MTMEGLQRQAAGWMLVATIGAMTLPAEAAEGYALGECKVARASVGAEISPITSAGSYLFNYHGSDPRYKEMLAGSGLSGGKVTLVKTPKHGNVIYSDDPNAASWNWYHYWPKDGYEGKDRFVMDVEKDGVKVRIHYLIEVIDEIVTESGVCNREQWKISSATHQLPPAS